MPFTIPTAKQLAAQFLAAIEVRINQTTPPVARAFNRVLSVALAMFGTGVYKYISDRALQTLALTATDEGLDVIGNNYGVTRKAAVASVLELSLVATAGTIIPVGTTFSAVATGETYTTLAAVTADAFNLAVLNAVASTAGDTGNLSVGEALAIGTPIAGANATAYVSATIAVNGLVVIGTDRELDSDYRRRVLTRIRAAGGGGNSADYREWGEAVADVARVFPYSGKPIIFQADDDFSITDGGGAGPFVITSDGAADFVDLGFYDGASVTITCSVPGNCMSTDVITFDATTLTVVGPLTALATENMTLINESLPGDRTVYVESISDPATCPAGTLTAVRDALNTDPETGISRMPLGLVDDRLYIESIYRTALSIFVVGLDVPASVDAEVKAKITAAVADYSARVCCFVGGLDYPGDRTDTISKSTLSSLVQGILRGYGGSVDFVTFEVGTVEQDAYTLSQGELVALGHAPSFVASYP